jgi:hypothetical protein
MREGPNMTKLLSSAVCLGLLTGACDKTTPLFVLPTARTGVSSTPAPAPAPQPRPFAPLEYTEIAVGQRFTGQVSAEPPECSGLPGWPCQYFRLTAPSDGTMVVELNYEPNTQPTQGVDLSIFDPLGPETWADYFQPGIVRARASVTAGTVYQITLWYTFPGLKFELQASLPPG